MNRRKFFRMWGLSVMTPLAVYRETMPSRYRGFDISIIHTDNKAPKGTCWQKPEKIRKYKYFYMTNNSVHNGIFLDPHKSDIEIWETVKPRVDMCIERYNKGAGRKI